MRHPSKTRKNRKKKESKVLSVKVDPNKNILALKRDLLLSIKRRKKFGELFRSYLLYHGDDKGLVTFVSNSSSIYAPMHVEIGENVIDFRPALSQDLNNAGYIGYDTFIGRVILARRMILDNSTSIHNTKAIKKDEFISYFIEDEIKKKTYKFIPNEVKLCLLFGTIAMVWGILAITWVLSAMFGVYITSIYFAFATILILTIPQILRR